MNNNQYSKPLITTIIPTYRRPKLLRRAIKSVLNQHKMPYSTNIWDKGRYQVPKVSIVMPTRNRAHLLKTALASALRQTYEDVEIVVSDNYSSDNTKAVVESFDSPKVRYVRTTKPLAMPDSWNFALSNAYGEYITYLTDDSYLFPDAIKRALSEMNRFNEKIIVWNSCQYFSPEWMDPKQRNLLYAPKFVSQSYLMQSEESLKQIFDMDIWIPIPKFLNSLCHRQLIEKAIQIQKQMFLPPCPDYSSALGLLKQVKNYVYIDRPLVIDGKFPESIGASSSFNFGQATKKFLSEFKDTSFKTLVEPDLPTISVSVAQTLEGMRKFYPNLPQINKKNLLVSSIYYLLLLKSNGADVGGTWQILEEYLSHESKEFRKTINKQKIYFKTRLMIKKFVPVLFLEYFDRWWRNSRKYWGKNCGFANLEECGKIAPKLIGR